MLGSLVRWLRILGLDVVYARDLDDAELVRKARLDGRTILTRDRKLVERRAARDHLLIESDLVDHQIVQVVTELGLDIGAGKLLGRCLRCNTLLQDVPLSEVKAHVPPYVAETQQEFRRCVLCDRVYWKATHVEAMWRRLAELGIGPGIGTESP